MEKKKNNFLLVWQVLEKIVFINSIYEYDYSYTTHTGLNSNFEVKTLLSI